MNKFVARSAAVGAMAVIGLGSAATASAVVAESRSAVDVIDRLEAQGHHVQINGPASVPLNQCRVTGVHGLNNSNIHPSGNRFDEGLYTTVYVDVVCQE